MRRLTEVTIKTLISLLILLIVLFQALVIWGLSSSTCFDELECGPAAVVLWGCVLAFGVCVQFGLFCVWKLVALVSEGRIFSEKAFAWVRALLIAVLAGMGFTIIDTLLVLAMRAGVPPMIVFVGVFVTLSCLGLALLITVMRALLRQATSLESELAEVV